MTSRQTLPPEPVAPVAPPGARDRNGVVLFTGAACLGAAALYTLMPLTAAIVLALWSAHLARPLFERVTRLLKGRESAAAVLLALLVAALLVPVALVLIVALPAAWDFVLELRSHGSQGSRGALLAFVSGGPGNDVDIANLVQRWGQSASSVAGILFSVSVEIAAGVFVYLAVFYGALTQGEEWYAWFERNVPLPRGAFASLAAAFHESGRGLLVGTGGTALLQGVVAGVAYAALGVPRALLLGVLSVIVSVIPLAGPVFVWGPVAAGLAMSGQTTRAVIMVIVGIVVIGTVDNVARPYFARRARIGLPTTLVLITMIGGVAAFGTWGILLGPLFVRLAVEALLLVRTRAEQSAEAARRQERRAPTERGRVSGDATHVTRATSGA